MSSDLLEEAARITETELPEDAILPVKFSDLRDLVADLDDTRSALVRDSRAEGELITLLSNVMTHGEGAVSAALRVIKRQRALIYDQVKVIDELQQANAEIRRAVQTGADQIEVDLETLGFGGEP